MDSRFGGVWTSLKNEEELEEGDVWESYNSLQKQVKKDKDVIFPVPRNSSLVSKRFKTTISQERPINNQFITIHQSSSSSAPVGVPDWSRIHGTKKTPGNSIWLEDYEDNDDDDDDDDDDELIPPHEWIARRQKWSFSVCEGAGRTLKGRDLSRVRNAVLIKTGFLES